MSMKKSTFDAVIVGGGAAGLFAAVQASTRGRRILLLEKNSRCGKKLLITGKGRCNVTNACTAEEALKNIPRNGRFLYSAMAAFPPEAAMAFFEQGGCPLKVERGNRVFPVSDRSADVLNVLERALQRGGVERRQTTVTGLSIADGAINGVLTSDGPVACSTVLLCTGGASYPLTGSTGDGYRLAAALGHTIDEKGKTVYQDFGELLFTHFGISGPTVLSASAHLKPGKSYSLVLDLKPALDEGKLDARFLRDLEAYANRSMENALADLFPHSMIPVLLRRAGIDPALRANSLTRQQRRALLEETKRFVIPISGTRPVEEAIITRGGVSTKEIDPRTMASKLVHGLHFAGELIDCDAYTGGFNLQIAWATAHAAAQVL